MAKFDANSTAEEIAKGHNLSGKNVIVTGGYAGIGVETGKAFAVAGANVFVIGRDLPKAKKVTEEMKQATGKSSITAMEVDLSSFASIRKFAEEFNKLNLPLHYLILNAGVMATPYGKTKDGFETQFGTNVLGHFLLANLLIPRLLEAVPARVVIVSSSAHCFGDLRFDDYNFEKGYEPWIAYGQSKTGDILFSNELNKRYKDKGITSNSLHPGFIMTDLQRHMKPDFLPESMNKIPGMQEAMESYSFKMKNPQQGAATTLYAALEATDGGKFYDDCHESKPAAWAANPESAHKLWDLATKLVGL